MGRGVDQKTYFELTGEHQTESQRSVENIQDFFDSLKENTGTSVLDALQELVELIQKHNVGLPKLNPADARHAQGINKVELMIDGSKYQILLEQDSEHLSLHTVSNGNMVMEFCI